MISFVSIEFLMFAAAVYLLYFLVPMKRRWLVLLGGSLYFYCAAGMVNLLFPLAAAGIAYVTARGVAKIYSGGKADKKRARPRLLLGIGLVLALFLYSKIGNEAAAAVVSILRLERIDFQVLVPLGVSYYTLSVIGYMADVYWQRTRAEENYLKLLLYMIYFPHILQGPIPRHKRLAPQLAEGRPFQYKDLCYGLQRMGWGYFKKLVIANRLALITQEVFGNYTSYMGTVFGFALVCAAVELYCDFSGGMDIALGLSEALSIRLDENFKRPFFSRSAAEFWRRWHITLGAWFRDYVFMPLAASPRLIRFGQALRERFGPQLSRLVMTSVPLAAVWLLTGLWHGTGMNYVAWGVYWGALIIFSAAYAPRAKRRNAELKVDTDSPGHRAAQVVRTFLLFLISRLLTAPGDLSVSLEVADRMTSVWNPEVFTDGTLFLLGLDRPDFYVGIAAVLILWAVELLQERGVHIRDRIASAPLPLRWGVYYAGVLIIVIFGVYGRGRDTFIYMNY